MNDVQMLHTQERRDAHPVGDLKRHQAVGKTLLPLKLGGISVELAKALAMRWASSKAWMPEKTELLVVVVKVLFYQPFLIFGFASKVEG
jgi:hypothetical protein